jgi:Flp pilus assembly protein TadD
MSASLPVPSTAPLQRRTTRLGVCVFLVALSWAALGGVVHNGFVNYDDDLYLTANPHLVAGSFADGVQFAFTTFRGGNWHPVTWLSHLVDVRLFGLHPGAHHAVGLTLHTANAVLLFLLLGGLTGTLWPSAVVAALFVVHPLHVESVAWAAERKDVLSTCFALGAALAYVGDVRRPGRGGARTAAPLLFALALLAKPMPLTLPLLLLLLDWWPLGRWSPTPGGSASTRAVPARWLPPARLWREKAPLLLLAGLSGIVTWIAQSGAGATQGGAEIPLPIRAANAALAYVGYLRKALWPHDLAAFYPYPVAGRPLATALSLAFVAGLCALALRQARSRPWLAVGLGWYLLSLLPVIGLVQAGEQAMADRYTYLPLTGIFVAAAWLLREGARRGGLPARVLPAAACVAIAILGVIAARQVATWHDSATLFRQAIAVTENNYIAHNNLGTELLRRGQAAESLPHFEATIRLVPNSPRGYQNLGRALAQLGRDEEAIVRFREAIARDDSDPLPHRNLGLSLEKLGRRDEALEAYREALRLQPSDPVALDLAGVALARAGQTRDAVLLLERARELDPGNSSIRAHLEVARAQCSAHPGRP